MTRDKRRPARRSEGLIVERLPGELLVYDQERDEAHCLHTEAATVFDLLDGTRTSAEIAALASLSETRVEEVRSELSARHLLDDGAEDDGLSRRDLIHRGALTGAGVAGAALITSIVAPLPAAAQSPDGCGPCDEDRRCGGITQDPCFCRNTDQGPQCINDIGPGQCSQTSDCPSGSFCILGETEGDCQANNGLCATSCPF